MSIVKLQCLEFSLPNTGYMFLFMSIMFFNLGLEYALNVLKMCLSKNIKKNNFHDLTHAFHGGMELVEGIEWEKSLEIVPSSLLNSLTQDNNKGYK